MEAMLDIVWMVLMGIVLTRIIVSIQFLNRYKKAAKEAKEEEQKMAEQKPEEPEEPIEMVTDAMDGTVIPKHQAYQLVKDDIVYYFRSWDERQEYIQQRNNNSQEA